MTKFQLRYFIVCLLSASIWVSLGQHSNADSTSNLEGEIAGLNHKVKKLDIENDNLRLKIDSLHAALKSLGNKRNTLEDILEEERVRSAQAAEVESATIAELTVAFRRAELAFNELKFELEAVQDESDHVRISALLQDIDEDFEEIRSKISNGPAKIHAPPEIHEQIKQRLDLMQAIIPERIERLLREKFPNTTNANGLGRASKLIFWLATMLVVVVVYATGKMVLNAVAHAGRIGFTIAFCGLASILSGVYQVVGIPLVGIGFVIIFIQALRKKR